MENQAQNMRHLLLNAKAMRDLLGRDPEGVEMGTGVFSAAEARAAIARFDDLAPDLREALGMPAEPAIAKHGFDLTDFDSTDGWRKVLAACDLTFDGEADHPRKDGEKMGWAWRNPRGLLVVTSCNPLTGDFQGDTKGRGDMGYASYMGVEGPAVEVKAAVAAIRKNAAYIKSQEAGRRSYI